MQILKAVMSAAAAAFVNLQQVFFLRQGRTPGLGATRIQARCIEAAADWKLFVLVCV